MQSLAWLIAPAACVGLKVLPGLGPGPIRFVAAFILLFIVPGWLALRLFMPAARMHPAERIVRAFLISIAVGSALGMAAWFFGGDARLGPVQARGAAAPSFLGRLDTIVWYEAAIMLAGAAYLILRRRPRSQAPEQARGKARQQARARRVSPQLLILIALVVVAAFIGLRTGGLLGYDTDAPDHVSCIREMVEQNRILPRTAFYIDGDGSAVDSRKGFYHVLAAATAQLSGVAPLELWDLLPALLLPFAVLIFFTFARRLLNNETAALLATFAALICFGDVGSGIFMRLNYGSHLGTLLAWGALALALAALLRERAPGEDSAAGLHPRDDNSALLIAAVAAFAAAAVHLFAAVQLLFAWGVFIAALLVLRGLRHRAFVRSIHVGAALLAGCALPVAWRLAFAFAPLNPIHSHAQGRFALAGKLYVVASGLWWHYLGPLGLVAVALSLLLWRRARNDDAALYLAALSIGPVLIVANPFIVPLVEPLFGYLIDRLLFAIPFLIVLTFIGYGLFQNRSRNDAPRRSLAAPVFAALMLVLFIPRFATFARSHSPRAAAAREANSILAWKDLYDRVETTVPRGSVVLSDPATSYGIPACTTNYTVGVLHQHGNPSDSLITRRLAASRDVLSPHLGSAEKIRVCERFGVEYVLLNQSFDRERDLYTTMVGPTIAARQRAALDADSSHFERLWSVESRGALYRVRREQSETRASSLDPIPESPPFMPIRAQTQLPASAHPVVTPAQAGIELAGVGVARESVTRGEALEVVLHWRRVAEAPTLPVKIQVRLDTPAPRGPLAAFGLTKLDRILQQRKQGLVYRLRKIHAPLEGQYGIERWPMNSVIADTVLVPIPRDAAVGAYAVKVSWSEQPLVPNLSLSDLIRNEDLYEGTRVATIQVRDSRWR